MYYTQYPSPVGNLLLTGTGEYLTGLWLNREPPADFVRQENLPLFQKAAAWLDAYFRGEDIPMEIPLQLSGTAFQKQVWQILQTVPYGQLRSYGSIAREMAAAMGKEKMSAQAVGQAVGSNPVSILIPCHRVVGAKGQLTGYGGGIDNKIRLLEHEGRKIANNRVL